MEDGLDQDQPEHVSPVHSSHSCMFTQRLVAMELARLDVVEHHGPDQEHRRGDPDRGEEVRKVGRTEPALAGDTALAPVPRSVVARPEDSSAAGSGSLAILARPRRAPALDRSAGDRGMEDGASPALGREPRRDRRPRARPRRPWRRALRDRWHARRARRRRGRGRSVSESDRRRRRWSAARSRRSTRRSTRASSRVATCPTSSRAGRARHRAASTSSSSTSSRSRRRSARGSCRSTRRSR